MALVSITGGIPVGSTDVVAPFNTPYNFQLATALSEFYFGLQASGKLYVTSNFLNPGIIPPGDTGEIAIFGNDKLIALPFGFSIVAIDKSATDPTIVGGGSLFVGNQDTTYWGTPAQGVVSIAAGDGNDLISLPVGTFYDVALGNGHDTVNANGSGTVDGGTGGTLFWVGGAADDMVDSNLINSYGANDTIVAGAGSVTINAYGANEIVAAGSGSMLYFGGSAGNPTIWGGSGTATLFGSSGQDITYFTGTESTPGADILAAGAGNETLNAGGAQVGVQLAAGIGTVDMIGSTGNDAFFGGSGLATMTGNGGDDIFNFASATEPGGQHGGTNIITDFNTSNDLFKTIGYGSTAAQAALAAATVSGGNTTVKLSDGTTIEFLGISNPNAIKYTST